MAGKRTSTHRVEFPFVIDALADVDTRLRRFFGSTAIYRDDKILLILHESDEHPYDSGVWVATEREHHESLRTDFPSLRSIRLFGTRETVWQNIPLDDPRFEREVIAVCEAIVAGDPRIGRVPKSRRRSTRSSSRTPTPRRKTQR